MIKMLTAVTDEADNIEAAIKSIHSQLEFEKNALKNSFGLIHCHPDFLETGCTKAICDSLPFPTIGCTSIFNGTDKGSESGLLSINIITSDSAEFTAIEIDPKVSIDGAVKTFVDDFNAISGDKKMIMAMFPLDKRYGSTIIQKLCDEIENKAPIFGTIACDTSDNFADAQTIFNGVGSTSKSATVVITGDFSPKFRMCNISTEKLQNERAIITDSDGVLLKEVNNMCPFEYLSSIGLVKPGDINGLPAVPFIVDNNDGTPPLARAMYTIDENGSIVCGAQMPVGSTLAIGSIDENDILKTFTSVMVDTKNTINEINGIICYPCLSRFLMLGMNFNAEYRLIGEYLGSDVPFSFCYSAGEICPVYDDKDNEHNSFHNFSVVACIF